MAFWTRKKEEAKPPEAPVVQTSMPMPPALEPPKELEILREAVSKPAPAKAERPVARLPRIELEKPPERPKFAPLFIKVDRYNEVLKNIESVKEVLLNIRDLLNLTQQLDKIKTESQLLLQKNIQEIARIVSELDKEFVRPKGLGIEEIIKRPIETERVEEYVSELQRELEGLRSRLQRVE